MPPTRCAVPISATNRTGFGELLDAGAGVGCDDRDMGLGDEERLDLRFGKVTGTDHDAGAGGELEEDGEEGHVFARLGMSVLFE